MITKLSSYIFRSMAFIAVLGAGCSQEQYPVAGAPGAGRPPANTNAGKFIDTATKAKGPRPPGGWAPGR